MKTENHKGATSARLMLQLSLRIKKKKKKTVMKSSKGLINLLNE